MFKIFYPSRFFSSAKRLRRGADGSVAVEFALIAPIFLYALISIIDIGLSHMAARSIDLGIETTTRLIRTGQFVGKSKNDFRDSICKSAGNTFFSCSKLSFRVSVLTRFSEAQNKKGPQPSATDPGGDSAYQDSVSSNIVLVQTVYPWTSLVPQFTFATGQGGGVGLSRTRSIYNNMLFQNEPF